MTLPLSSSLPLHRETFGEGGSPVLLIHGFGTNGHTWNHWIPALSRRHRVVVVELKGFGDAPKPRDDAYGPEDQATLVHHLILQENLRDLTLVGHSLGGTIALLTALKLMEDASPHLTRLVLLAGAAYPLPVSRYIRLAGTPFLGPLLLRLLPSRYVVRKALELAYHDPDRVTQTRVEAYAEALRRPGGRHALSRTARRILPPDASRVTARYPELDIPTLLVWGREDPIVPVQVGERLQDELPRGRLEILEGCGHMPQEEEPGATLEMLLDFLAP
mgnify:CR=1 FL=1